MRLEKIIGIYKITSPTGRIYIGQSVDIMRRFKDYKKLINCNEQAKLYNSFLKHGVENHVFEVIHECSEEELNYWEIHYGKLFNVTGENGLNIRECGGAYGSHSVETKKKMSESRSGENHPMYGKLGIDNPNFGSKRNIETRKFQSELKKGKYEGVNNPNYGNECKLETKSKISKKAKIRLSNVENHPMYNKKHSSKSIEMMRNKKLGKKLTPEIIAKREATRILLRQERRTMVF